MFSTVLKYPNVSNWLRCYLIWLTACISATVEADSRIVPVGFVTEDKVLFLVQQSPDKFLLSTLDLVSGTWETNHRCAGSFGDTAIDLPPFYDPVRVRV